MTTMLDKCAVAGDITQGIDRRGVWTAAITVIGGTSGTAVKLVSSDTVNGEYTDYKTLISASDAETDQYKGFVVDLHGAKKYIKVTGAVMATAVFGDCDHDVKNIAITAGEVPSVADLENNKAATIDASTYTSPVEVTPSEGKYGMKKATITLSNIPTESDLEDNKTVSITENGVVEITPSAGKDGMKKVTATINVAGGGSATAYAWKATYDEGGTQKTYYYYTTFAKAPADKDAWENEKILYVNLDTNLSKLGDIEVITGFHIAGANPSDADYQKDSDTQFTVIWGVDDTSVFTRDDTKDFTLWG